MPPDPTRPATHRRRYGALIAAALIVGACAAFAMNREATPIPIQQATVTKLLDPAEIFRVEPMRLTQTLILSGEIRPLRRVTISAELGGIAADVGPRAGQPVAAGATLLTIAEGDHQLALRAEESALAALLAERRVAGASLQRASELAERGAAARATLEQAQGAVDVLDAQISAAETRVALAQANLRRTRPTAPFAGDIISRAVEPGQLVAQGDALFEIADLSVVTLNALVPIAQASGLRPGLTADLWFPENPATRYGAKLVRIGAEAAPGTRALPVWFEIDNRSHGLRAGSFLIGEVVMRQAPDALAVPRSALHETDGATSVLAIRDGVAVQLPVQPGAEWQNGLVAIEAGLVAGDRIALLPLSGLGAGDAVRIGADAP